ncbi:MAG: hypothetical protein KC518_08605, partial [Candidatus Cloacimonetes bacterium]|nr:hypothetical protein [Candidatus Cloacimonadota bacterium]
MKNALTTLVVCGIVAGAAMADSSRKTEIQTFDWSSRTTDCSAATPLASGTYSIAAGEDFFFSYTGTGAGIAFDTCDPLTEFDTDVRVFDACGGTQLFYKDGPSGPCGWQTNMTCNDMIFADGVEYIIVIHGFGHGSGEFGLFNLTMGAACDPPAGPPANDDMADAEEITVDGACISGNTTLATNDNLPPLFQHACYTGYYSATSSGASTDVWYWFESTGGCYTVSLCGSTYDTVLALYDGSGTPIATDDDECSLQSEITSYAAGCWLPAGPILVAVDGYGSSKGDFTLCVSSCTPSDTQDMPVAFELGKAFP